MTIKKMWMFTIVGEDETDIHGRRYRVQVRQLARKSPEIRGSVRNIKGSPEIEVRRALEDEAKALAFRTQLEQALNADKGEEKKLVFSELRLFHDDDSKYQDFSVIREDELTEMVWALQGAGDVFLTSSEKILEVMVTRDLKKERGLLGALELEVGFVTEKIGEMIAEIKAGKPPGKFQFEQDCLRKALVEPAWADNDRFLQLTSDLFHSMNREDESPFESASREDQLKELENLNKVASQYHEMINTRIEELDRKIGTKHTNIKDN